MEESVRKEVVYGLEILSPREINVITAYYGLDGNKPMSLDEISDMYDLSKERVRQIRDRAIRRMRKSITRTTLRTILE